MHPQASTPTLPPQRQRAASQSLELVTQSLCPRGAHGKCPASRRPDSSLVEGQKVNSKQAGLKEGSGAWNQEEGPPADPSCAATWTGAGREPGLGTLLGRWEVTNAHIRTEPLPGPRPRKGREETGCVT